MPTSFRSQSRTPSLLPSRPTRRKLQRRRSKQRSFWEVSDSRKRMRSGDRPGLQNRRAAGFSAAGGFHPPSLPPFFNNLAIANHLQNPDSAPPTQLSGYTA